MTNKEYISQYLKGLGEIPDALWSDCTISLNAEYSPGDIEVGKEMVSIAEVMILSPRVENVSENGFSFSYNYDYIASFYRMLCKKYSISPNEEVLSAAGVSIIRDNTDMW